MFEQAGAQSRNKLSDWMIRGGIAVIYLLEGADKFGANWVEFFQQIGFGQWFRYFTGVIEIGAGVLVLIPWTVEIGLALLACTMASAALILIFVMHNAADSVFPGAFLIGLAIFLYSRKSG